MCCWHLSNWAAICEHLLFVSLLTSLVARIKMLGNSERFARFKNLSNRGPDSWTTFQVFRFVTCYRIEAFKVRISKSFICQIIHTCRRICVHEIYLSQKWKYFSRRKQICSTILADCPIPKSRHSIALKCATMHSILFCKYNSPVFRYCNIAMQKDNTWN